MDRAEQAAGLVVAFRAFRPAAAPAEVVEVVEVPGRVLEAARG
jgi:hypothetical protein